MAKSGNKKLVKKISDLVLAELGKARPGSAGEPGLGYNCTSHTFNCGNEYNCSQTHGCSNNYKQGLKEREKGEQFLSVDKDLSKQIQGILERDIGKLIDPIINMSQNCDASSYTCDSTFSCGGIGFKCNNKFTG